MLIRKLWVLCLLVFCFCTAPSPVFSASAGSSSTRVQTDVDRAEHHVDALGVPVLRIEGLGEQRHPAWIGAYALAYAGIDAYDERLLNLRDKNKFHACVDWLKKNLKLNHSGLWVWQYQFDSTYNDISIQAPWFSAFGQALGIQALVAAYQQDQDLQALNLAKKAAKALFTPLKDGGLLFERGSDIWFEEIPVPVQNPSHILNGHMRTLLALKELADVTHDAEILKYFKRGMDSLYHWLPLYDAGYWLRYDLNPKKEELLFRFANPYGLKNYPLAIHRISLRDPVTKEETSLDIGGGNDAQGPARIAGIHWGQAELVAGKKVRRLVPVATENEPEVLSAPHSYFYLKLPGKSLDNLRRDWYELSIDYFDESGAGAAITVQERSIAPGQAFRDMRDGDLHLTGQAVWRHWVIPVRASDLGFWVGSSYALKHSQYLKQLAEFDPRLLKWARVSVAYLNDARPNTLSYTESSEQFPPLARQLPMLPFCSLDKAGVLMVHQAGKNSKFLANGNFDSSSDKGRPQYNPFIIADQLLKGPNSQCTNLPTERIKRAPALAWLLDSKNQRNSPGSITYQYNFKNIYNDVVTPKPWASAFSQAYIIKALLFAAECKMESINIINPMLEKLIRAFAVDVKRGGVASLSKENLHFFEEVPNASHVLNAHLISLNALHLVGQHIKDASIAGLYHEGLQLLKEKLYLFNSGYWLRYDLNPKKEILFELEWKEEKQQSLWSWFKKIESPLFESITLQNLETARQSTIHAGSKNAFNGINHLSGCGWMASKQVKEHTARAFQKGYLSDSSTGARIKRKTYFTLGLPSRDFDDPLDVPLHHLRIHYLDRSAGHLKVKIQAINEGNHLAFVPLRSGIIHTTGDQQWKTAYITIRPADLGWYVGPDYQEYEVQQIQDLADLTNDQFLRQFAEMQRDYLMMKAQHSNTLFDDYNPKDHQPIKVRLVDSSQTYSHFGFENALQPVLDRTHYVSGMDGEKLAYMTVDLGKRSPLGQVSLHWLNANFFAKKIRLISLDDGEKLLKEVEITDGVTSHIHLDHRARLQHLKIEFSDFQGMPRLLLNQMVLWPKDRGTWDDHYIDSKDTKNPIALYRIPVTERIKKLSDDLTQGIKQDKYKIQKFMDYIDQFKVGVASDISPDTAVREQVGACGTFSNTLLALAAGQGIQGRVISLANVPKNNGHALAEVKINGKWQLYDPSFNAYYSISDSTEPLSFLETKSACTKNPKQVLLHVKNPRPDFKKFAGCTAIVTANPSGVISGKHVMLYPLELDLKNSNNLVKAEFGPENQGANYIGLASSNHQQNWHLKNLVKGRVYQFVLNAEYVDGDLAAGDRTFLLLAGLRGAKLLGSNKHHFDLGHRTTAAWHIKFIAEQTSVYLKLWHPYHGRKYRSLHPESYALSEVTRSDSAKIG